MESQSTQPSLTLRQTIPTRPSPAMAAAAVAAATNTAGSSFALPVELMMYSNARPLVPPPLQLPNCLFSNQFCSCVYGAPSQPCSIHHAPIAYGQASSSFVAPTTSTTAPASIPPPGQLPDVAAVPSASVAAPVHLERSVEMARRETRLPPTLQPIRTSMRLKRGAPTLPPQVQTALEEAGRAPKLRRVPSENGREIQTVASETMQQPPVIPVGQITHEPAAQSSTSQLVTGTVPSSHGTCQRCHGSSPGQCPNCPTACQCFCPALNGSRTTIVQPAASRNNYILPAQTAAPMPQLFPGAQSQHAPILPQQHVQLATVEQILQSNRLREQMRQHHTQQMINSAVQTQSFRYSYLANGQLFVPVRGTTLGLEALLVNVTHPGEFWDGVQRPLDRHHMFGAPVTEQQPIGCSLQDIEKYSEKLQFVKDIEIPDAEQERCIVCQCELETGEEIRHLSCNHQFHVDCIDRWLGYNKKCPVCRLDIDQPKEKEKDSVWIE